jgi:ribosomal protein S17E
VGKAIVKGLKTKADLLLKTIPERFSTDFEKNKGVLVELGIPFTKLNRNLLAGYITREVKKKQAS